MHVSRTLPWRLADTPDAPFPPASSALRHPDGLLAVGGDLSPVRLLNAYAGGIFPWFSEGEPILWWSPDPRMVFRTEGVRLSSRFRRTLRRSSWEIRADTAFETVMRRCALAPRPGQDGTWISEAMIRAYVALHRLGFAHSVEVWEGRQLVGGLYGVCIGSMFFAESMFSDASGGSKAALAALARLLQGWGVAVIDAQVENPHLRRMGAEQWPRTRFLDHVHHAVRRDGPGGSWATRVSPWPARHLADG